MGLILDEMNKLSCANVGGGENPHAGGANVCDGGLLALIEIAPSMVIRFVDGEQDLCVLGDSLACSFFAGCAHGVLVVRFAGL